MSSRTLLRVAGLQKLFPIKKGFWKRTVGHVRAVDGVDFHIDEPNIEDVIRRVYKGELQLDRDAA